MLQVYIRLRRSKVLRTRLFTYLISFLVRHVTSSLLYLILLLAVVTFLLTLIWSILRLYSSVFFTSIQFYSTQTSRSDLRPSLTLDQSSFLHRFCRRRRLSGSSVPSASSYHIDRHPGVCTGTTHAEFSRSTHTRNR